MKKKSTPFYSLLGVALIALIVVVVLALANSRQSEISAPETSVYAGLPQGVNAQGLHFLGSEDAPVSMLVYEDLGCHNCRDFFLNTEPHVIADFIATGQVRLLVETLAFVNDQSLPAAEALYCAADQGYFWEYRDVLYHNQGVLPFTRSNLLAFADELALDAAVFANCYDKAVYLESITSQTERALSFGVSGTPTFEINGTRYVGAYPYAATGAGEDGVQALLQAALDANVP